MCDLGEGCCWEGDDLDLLNVARGRLVGAGMSVRTGWTANTPLPVILPYRYFLFR